MFFSHTYTCIYIHIERDTCIHIKPNTYWFTAEDRPTAHRAAIEYMSSIDRRSVEYVSKADRRSIGRSIEDLSIIYRSSTETYQPLTEDPSDIERRCMKARSGIDRRPDDWGCTGDWSVNYRKPITFFGWSQAPAKQIGCEKFDTPTPNGHRADGEGTGETLKKNAEKSILSQYWLNIDF